MSYNNMRNGYRLNSGNKDTKYVQVLNILMYGRDKGVARKDVHIVMGWNPANGNRSAMWAELHRIGYTRYNAKRRTLHITDKGINYLRSNDLFIDYTRMCTILKRQDYFNSHILA